MAASSKCPTWQDHEFNEPRIVATGHHPVLGPYQREEVACQKCPLKVTETKFLKHRPIQQFGS